ncbi:unnamed protein product [Sphagnum troendelagicum]
MVRTAASSEPAAQAESLPFMSLVDASSKQHEDGEPEQMMRQLSIRDQEQGEDFNQNNVQQVLEHNIALRRNFDDVRVILLAAFPYASTYLAFLELQHGQVEASAFTAHRVKCTTSGCLLAAPRREACVPFLYTRFFSSKDEVSDHEGVMLSGSVEEETRGRGPLHKE